jgi:hypothetical protein
MTTDNQRKGNPYAIRHGIHGGCIERAPESGNDRKINARPAGKPTHFLHTTISKVNADGSFEVGSEEKTERTPAPAEDAEVNALEAALQRTPFGRQMLYLMEEVAALRIHEALGAELVRGATEDLERLRRKLLSCGEIERHRIAARIPEAERELAKWRAAHRDYQTRRERIEAEIRAGARALA